MSSAIVEKNQMAKEKRKNKGQFGVFFHLIDVTSTLRPGTAIFLVLLFISGVFLN